MSASERLKALDEGLPENEWPNADVVFSLLSALPQIVAVVEAAERFVAAVDYSMERGLKPSLGEATAERVRLDELLRPALDALDEALS